MAKGLNRLNGWTCSLPQWEGVLAPHTPLKSWKEKPGTAPTVGVDGGQAGVDTHRGCEDKERVCTLRATCVCM
jgi:hypothetical protein